MTPAPWLWIVFTLIAAAAQTVRNTTQRGLTKTLGTTGATHVRFLFGFPFALLFLAGVAWTRPELPVPTLDFWPWVIAGALAQILATALMLKAMSERSFVVAIAYTKTEPALVALFGLIFLGDVLTLGSVAAIALVTFGVIAISIKPKVIDEARAKISRRPMLLGIGSGATFAMSAVTLRGAILSLHSPDYLASSTLTVTINLGIQAVLLTAYLALRRRSVLIAVFHEWRRSMLAGFMGAFASQFWLLGFAITSAAHVRTLALVEVPLAQAVTHYAFKQKMTRYEALGIVLVVAGVLLLVSSSS